MRTSPLHAPFLAAFFLGGAFLALIPNACAQVTSSLTTLRSFNGPVGEQPNQALTENKDGSLYGVTPGGGANASGTIYRVTPDGSLTLLHSFLSSTDGGPSECKLLLANDGYFYGTTTTGGTASTSSSSTTTGGGTVFRISPPGIFSVLYTFPPGGASGQAPTGGLVQGGDGNLYGTTTYGGSTASGAASGNTGDGTAFRLGRDGTFTLLHSFDFHQTGIGGYAPSTIILGSGGNFYGVASGGDNGVGVIYKMSAGGAVFNLHSFNVTDGSAPLGPLVEGDADVFYGITAAGGSFGGGTFFKVTSSGVFTVLYSFAKSATTTTRLQSGLIKAADGNFYLVTGNSSNGGIVQLTPDGVAAAVYNFNGNTDGSSPTGALVQTEDGSFYGTTTNGGASNFGTVFRLDVASPPPFFDGAADLGNGVRYLAFPNGNVFGYYSPLPNNANYIYHFDLGYEYIFDANDGEAGVYFYDFQSQHFFYTSPTFAFPYLYDFTLNAVLYYYPNLGAPGRYTSNPRYFYNFATGKIITQ